MTVELRPFGVKCNLACHYCYQNPQRDAGNQRLTYDLEKMKAAALKAGEAFSLFGGEPLLMPIDDLEHLFAWGLETFGSNGIQTNGVLITDHHIELFRRYKVSVGISIDGPGELNDARWMKGGLAKTRESTAKVEDMIARLCKEYQAPGLIATLHKGNASADKIPIMLDWVRHLDAIGIRNMRLHLLEVDNKGVQDKLALSPVENVEALLAFASMEGTLKGLRFDLFREMEQLLQGQDGKVSCTWRACDSYTTVAVQGIEGNGQTSNCGRTNKDGIGFIKAKVAGFERPIALYRTSQKENGCSGCRFFLMCKGQCPGTAIDGDWRNRTEHCEIWMKLFSVLERKMIIAGTVPLTIQPERLEIEKRMISYWERGRNPSISWLLNILHKTPPALQAKDEVKTNRTRIEPRISWVSNDARDLWSTRLDRFQTVFEDMTLFSSSTNTNTCNARLVPASSFHRLLNLASKHSLGAAMLPSSALPNGICTKPGEGNTGLLITGTAQAVSECKAAYDSGDLVRFRKLLNLPQCCLEHGSAGVKSLELRQTMSTHTLLAPLGLSILPLYSCDHECQSAQEAAEAWLEAASARGYSEEVTCLRECFSWAINWSLLNGVLEIKTPLFKLCVLSDLGIPSLHIRRLGVSVVPESAKGLKFPYFAEVKREKTTKDQVRL